MKPVAEWTEADLLALVGSPETTTLEFKGSAILNATNEGRAELSKTVSALANAAGGVLVYGVVENKQIATGLDAGVDPREMSVERIDQMISSTISPRVQGVGVRQIPLSTHPGRVAYAIDVPQATTLAPHQALDKKYYKRSNARSEPMHDYEVRDVMRRGRYPELYLNFDFNKSKAGVKTPDGRLVRTFRVTAGNHNHEPALYRITTLSLDVNLGNAPPRGFRDAGGGMTGMANGKPVALKSWHRNAVPPAQIPLFHGQLFSEVEVDLSLTEGQIYAFHCSISCPGCRVAYQGAICWLGGETEPTIDWGPELANR